MENVEGRNAVLELFNGNRRVDKIFLQKGSHGQRIDKIIDYAQKNDVPLQKIDKKEISKIADSYSHQGVVACAEEIKFVAPEDIVAYAREKEEAPFILILDQIQDPQNFGSIIRTAHSAGVHGIIFPQRRAAGITPVVSKAAAGALEYIKLSQVSNINYAIKSLKEDGVWITGTDVDSSRLIYDVDYTDGTAVVIGNEGSGMRRLVKENCDFLVKIPMCGKLNSLNASVAAGIMLYEVVRQRS